MRRDDLRHRVKVGDLVSHCRTTLRGQVTEMGIVISWSPRRGVANVIFGSGEHQVHVRKLKVIK